MPLRRTAIALTATSSLLLTAFAPAGSATATTAKGTAATTSVPLLVEAAGTSVALGELSLLATTDDAVTAGAPFASTGLTLADVGGARFGELQTRSDGTTTLPGATLDRATPAGGITAEAVSLLSIADDVVGSAAAVLTTLDTAAALELAELDGLTNPTLLDAEVSNAVATVDNTGSAASHTLVFSGVELGIEHLLGDALETLPLQDLLALAGALDVLDGLDADLLDDLDLPVDVQDALTDLLAAVDGTATAADAVAAAATALTDAEALDPLADHPAFGNESALESQAALLDGLDATAGGIAGLLAAVGGLSSVITTPLFSTLACTLTAPEFDANVVNTRIGEALACVQGALDDLQGAVDALDDEVAALDLAVTDYLAAVAAVEDALTVLDGLGDALDTTALLDAITALLDDLLTTDVLASDPIRVTQSVRAMGGELDGSSANTNCTDSTATILGTVLATEGCNAGDAGVVQPALDALNGLFDEVPAVDAGDGIVLELFGTVEDEVTAAADGTVTATSVAEVLRLEIPSLVVSPCDVAGGLACSLGVDLDGLLGDALTDVDGTLDGAFTTVDDALTGVTDLLTALDAVAPDASAGSTVESLVEASLAALDGIIEGLDLGGLLSGDDLTLTGATVVVDPQLEAVHQITTASVDTPTPADPAPADPAPAAPAPTPTNDPTLPNTGGGAALLAVLALGAGTWLWRRREA